MKNLFTDEITDGFILMPVMIGVKWRPGNNLYFAGKVGAVAGLKNIVAKGFDRLLAEQANAWSLKWQNALVRAHIYFQKLY